MNNVSAVEAGGGKMTRIHQAVLIGSFLPCCWLAMMAVHESGHVLAARATGGLVTKVVVHPLAISRTDLGRNPNPLVVAWAGPVVGVAAPLAAWGALWLARFSCAHLARFFAGFCAVANGAYLGVGAISGAGDAGDLVRYGSPAWILVAFGAIATPLGLALWHGLGPYFGLGDSRGRVDKRTAYWSLALLVLTWSAAVALSPRS